MTSGRDRGPELDELLRQLSEELSPLRQASLEPSTSAAPDWSGEIERTVSSLLPATALWMAMSPEDVAARLTRVRVDRFADVNGYVITTDGWHSFEIRLHWGLLDFLYKMSVMFAATIGLSDDGDPVVEPKLPLHETQATLVRLVNAFWDGTLVDTRTIPTKDLADHQMYLGAFLYSQSRRFVVAHELAHVILALGSPHIQERAAGIALARQAVSLAGETHRARWRLPRLARTQDEGVLESWAEEISADLIAVKLLVDGAKTPLEAVLRWSAVDWLFVVQELLEDRPAPATRSSTTRAGTHPSSRARRAAMRHAARHGPAGAFEFGNAFERWIQDAWGAA